MPALHMGVIDQPYRPPPGKRSQRRVVTTGQVAEWLETKYHVMEIYVNENGQRIADALTRGVVEASESLAMGAPATLDPFGAACSEIDAGFRHFLSNKDMERLGYPGVPTQAALRGVSHRFKHPYARRAPRPSFIDTGTYQSSEKSWVD